VFELRYHVPVGPGFRLIRPTDYDWFADPKTGFASRRKSQEFSGAPSASFVELIQSDLPCPVPFSKIFLSPFHPNQNYKPRRLVPHEGRIAIVTDAGRDAVDAVGAFDERC
jgi:hypothetical protein